MPNTAERVAPHTGKFEFKLFVAAGHLDGNLPDKSPAGIEKLTTHEVPTIPQEQLDEYKPENLQFRQAGFFNPSEVLGILRRALHIRVGTVDIGGDKIATDIREYGKDDKFSVVVTKEPKKSKEGADYVAHAEEAAGMFRENGVKAIGTSFAGPIEGTKPIVATNIPILQKELDEKYQGDLANIFISSGDEVVAGDNDAISGLMAATIEAYRKNPKLKRVIYLIHGGGLGGAVWEDGQMIAAEPGHVPVIDEMNPFEIDEPCGQKTSPNKDKTCVEKVGSSGQGVEKTFEKITSKKLSGIEISKIHQNSNGEYSEEESKLATAIYDTAARIVATGALGLDQARGSVEDDAKRLDPETTAVVIHGGLMKTPGVPERVEQILEKHLGYKPNLLYTKDFSDNACSDGAAIRALMAMNDRKASSPSN